MTRPRSTASYPRAYLDYVSTLNVDPTIKITIEFDSTKEARKFRQDFYAFRLAAKAEGLDVTYPELNALMVTLSGVNAVIQHRDYTDVAIKMQKALEEAKKHHKIG